MTHSPSAPSMKVTRIYDYIHPELLRPVRASVDFVASHASLGLTPTTSQIESSLKISEFIKKQSEDSKYEMLFCKTASIGDTSTTPTSMMTFKNNVDLDDMAFMEEKVADISSLVISSHAWSEWCRHRAKVPYTHPDFSVTCAKTAYSKLRHVLGSVNILLTWRSPVAHAYGVGGSPSTYALFHSNSFRHLFVVCDYTIVHYEFSDNKESGIQKALHYAKHSSGAIPVSQLTFSKQILSVMEV